MIVADFNLIPYLLINGDKSKEVRELYKSDPDWFVPSGWRHELRSLLNGMVIKKMITGEQSVKLCELADKIFEGKEYPVKYELVLKLSEYSGVSLNECEYPALAYSLGVKYVTFDKKVAKVFPDITERIK